MAQSDNALFENLVNIHSDAVTRVCYMNLSDRADAEDAWQNVFMKLWKSQKMWDKPESELHKWLVTVALNECRDIKRRLFHRSHFNIDELNVEYTEDFDKEVITAVKDLPEKYSSVIYLYYFEGYDIREISSILSANENTVKSRLKRGKEMLKGVLRNE
ncbi:MAG: sigma-70 family RNA polymerase sigma factor [Clostridia bacterium]|nr:sigma-70 family RNA polymerase sigma factor [Clostridia bacterium]